MLSRLFCPDLLDTGPVADRLWAIRDGLVNVYVVQASSGLLCIDTGWRSASVSRGFKRLGLSEHDVVGVFVTHLHWDHVRCLSMFPAATVFVGEHESPSAFTGHWPPKQAWEGLRDGQVVTVGDLQVQSVATPGHTSGSVSYVVAGRWLFTGDACRLKSGDAVPLPAWLNRHGAGPDLSLRRLAALAEVECLLTAHSGISRDVGSAFSRWRGVDNRVPTGECGA